MAASNLTSTKMLLLSYETFLNAWKLKGPTDNFLEDFYEELRDHHQISFNDLYSVAAIIVVVSVQQYISRNTFNKVSFVLNRSIKYILIDKYKCKPYCCWLFENELYIIIFT